MTLPSDHALRVLQVTPVLGPGGAEHVAAYLACSFSQPGTVALCSAYGGAYARYLRARKVRFAVFEPTWRHLLIRAISSVPVRRRLVSSNSPSAAPDGASRLPPQRFLLDGVHGFWEWLETLLAVTSYDVVHIHSLSCLGVSRLAKTSDATVVYTHHNVLSDRHGPADIAFLGEHLRSIDRVILPSKSSQDDFTRVSGYPESSTVVIPSPTFLASGVKRLSGTVQRFGTASNLQSAKGIDVLLAGWKVFQRQRPFVRLLIAGGSSRIRAYWTSVANHLGLGSSVRFLGELRSERRIGRFYDEVDAIVIPSRSEALSLLAIEAMSRGIPVVASDIPALRQTLGAAGLFFPSEDSRGLAYVLDQLAEDPGLAVRISSAGYELWRTEFAPDAIISAHRTLYSSILPGISAVLASHQMRSAHGSP